MKIGLFDSGLGGLFVAEAIFKALPEYNYVYLGDTQNVPYGDRSQEEIYYLTKRAVSYLLNHDCNLVLLLCNTASAQALRKLQHEGYRALGIIIPTVEEISGDRIGIVATQSTVDSGTYIAEIQKYRPGAHVFQQAAPRLVPLIESGASVADVLPGYLEPLLQNNIDTLILGCTHYVILKEEVRKLAPGVRVISQDELISDKLKNYLTRHPEIENTLSKKSARDFLFTKHPRLEGFGNFDRSSVRLVVLDDVR